MNVKSPLMVQGSIRKILTEKSISAKLKIQTIHLGMKNGTFDTQIEIDFVNDKIPLLNGFMPGEEVQVSLNITGNVSKNDPDKIYNNIRGWKIERMAGELNSQQQNNLRQATVIADDLGF